jgi:hypothetical protein
MTSGAADPSSLLSYATTNWPLASPTETRGAEVTGADRGSRQLSCDQSPQTRAISAPGYVEQLVIMSAKAAIWVARTPAHLALCLSYCT